MNLKYKLIFVLVLIGFGFVLGRVLFPNRPSPDTNPVVDTLGIIRPYEVKIDSIENILKQKNDSLYKVLKKYKWLYNEYISIKFELDSIVNSSEADTVTEEFAEYSDSVVSIRYYFATQTFWYKLLERKIRIDILKSEKGVLVDVYDPLFNKHYKSEVEFYKKPESFWSRFHLYYGVAGNSDPAIGVFGGLEYNRTGIMLGLFSNAKYSLILFKRR